jgi:hypothetical protein
MCGAECYEVVNDGLEKVCKTDSCVEKLWKILGNPWPRFQLRTFPNVVQDFFKIITNKCTINIKKSV